MDRLTLHGMKFYSHSGLHSFEKDVGQLFEIDVDCLVDLDKACHTDHLSDTVDYPHLFSIVKDIMEANPPVVSLDTSLDEVMKHFGLLNIDELPIVADNKV